jgi:dihydrofolate synthase/folylpolyglutamate synthase
MGYQEALAFLAGAERFGSVLGLGAVRELLRRMGDPQAGLACAHIAGTNGKGSVAACLASVLQAAGARVGRFTSPDLLRFNERIQVGGEDIADADVARLTGVIARHCREMARDGFPHPTVFEISAAMAFARFAESGCDAAVLETGLGGRLDATNAIPAPLVAVITPIGMDHMDRLGATLAEIAREKAGILKPGGGAVVMAAQAPEAEAELLARCREVGAEPVTLSPGMVELGPHDLGGQDFRVRWPDDGLPGGGGWGGWLRTPLLGEHQAYNAALAAVAARAMAARSPLFAGVAEGGGERAGAAGDGGEAAIRAGLIACRWPGRFELVLRGPCPVVVDGAHNPHGAWSLRRALERHFPGRRAVFVVGVLRDKEYEGMLRVVAPLARRFYTLEPPGTPRALGAAELARAAARATGLPAEPCASVGAAMGAAWAAAAAGGDVLCAFGSLYYIGHARLWRPGPAS